MSNIPRLATTAVAIGLTTTLAVAPAASAHQSHHRGHHHHAGSTGHPGSPGKKVLADGLLSPLRAAVARNGTAYVSENFAGKIDRIGRDGTKTTVYTDPNGYEVGGLSLAGRNLLFTVTYGVEQTNYDSWLKVLTPSGHVHTIADLFQYDKTQNPDQVTSYGISGLDPSDPSDAACLAKWPTAENGPATYSGQVDSHPYATYPLRNGWTLVADAGGNDVLAVSPSGRIRTVAVLPAIPFRITAAAAGGLGIDPCFVGATYNFEPVPTDVEVGSDGTIYVTSLPGGPEGPQLGARGSVFAISPSAMYGSAPRQHATRRGDRHGDKQDHRGHGYQHGKHGHRHPGTYAARQVVTGLLGPTGLAVKPNGTMYVAQMFGNEISRVTPWRHSSAVSDFISTPTPGEVEWTPRGLYYTSNVLSGTPEDPGGSTTPAGQLVRARG